MTVEYSREKEIREFLEENDENDIEKITKICGKNKAQVFD